MSDLKVISMTFCKKIRQTLAIECETMQMLTKRVGAHIAGWLM